MRISERSQMSSFEPTTTDSQSTFGWGSPASMKQRDHAAGDVGARERRQHGSLYAARPPRSLSSSSGREWPSLVNRRFEKRDERRPTARPLPSGGSS